MTDLCFFEIINGVRKLRAPVVERIEYLPQSTAWLEGGTPRETELVQHAVKAAMVIVQHCLNFEPEQRPDASDISAELTNICNWLEPWPQI